VNPDSLVTMDPEDHEDLEDLEDQEVTTLLIYHPTHPTTTQLDDLPDEEPLHWNITLGCFRPLQTHLLPELDHQRKQSSTTSTSLAISPYSMETTTRSLLLFAFESGQTADFSHKANCVFGDPYLLQQVTKTQTKYIFRIRTTRRRARFTLDLD
jgi:hypothetical protein